LAYIWAFLLDVHQFSIITELLGTPPDDVIATICSENTLRFVQNLPKRERIPFSQRFAEQEPQAIDLLEKMLVFDPRKRITATEALAHPYLSPYHDPSDEPAAPEKFDWSFNDADLPIDTWKGNGLGKSRRWHGRMANTNLYLPPSHDVF
jgi:p38 MAP kinase